jgi:hypothetical protein
MISFVNPEPLRKQAEDNAANTQSRGVLLLAAPKRHIESEWVSLNLLLNLLE